MAPAAGRSTYHHGDLRRALLEVAADQLEIVGPERLSLRQLARAAGVSQSAPYNHFAGRQDLLAAVATAGFHELTTSLSAIADRPADVELLVEMGVDYVRSATARPQRYRLMFGTGIDDWSAHAELAGAKAGAAVPVRTALAGLLYGTSRPDPDVLRRRMVPVWALVHGLAMLRIDGDLPEDKHGETAGLVRDAVRAVLGEPAQSAAVIPPSTNTIDPLR